MSKCKLKSKEGKSLRSKCIKKSVIRNSYVTEQLMGMFCQLCLEVIDDTSYPLVKDIISFCSELDLYKHLGFVKQVRCRTAYTWFRKLNITTPILKKKANADVKKDFRTEMQWCDLLHVP